MALKITRGERPHGALISDRRLYLTADKETVVEEGDARSAYLFATEGYEISSGSAEKYGLVSANGRVALPGAEPPAVREDAAETTDDPANADATDDDGADDARGGEDAPEWPLKTPPEEYLEKSPDGPKAELARAILAVRGSAGDA